MTTRTFKARQEQQHNNDDDKNDDNNNNNNNDNDNNNNNNRTPITIRTTDTTIAQASSQMLNVNNQFS